MDMEPNISRNICPVYSKAYVHNGHFARHRKNRHLEAVLEILEKRSKEIRMWSGHAGLNMYEIDIDDILPAGTLILIDRIEYHPDGPQPTDDSVDANTLRRSRFSNPYTPFLDEHELE